MIKASVTADRGRDNVTAERTQKTLSQGLAAKWDAIIWNCYTFSSLYLCNVQKL